MNTKTGVLLGSLIILLIAAVFIFGRPGSQDRVTARDVLDAPLVPANTKIVKFNPDNPVLKRIAEGADKYALYIELIHKGDGESLFLAGDIISNCTNVLQQGLERTMSGFEARLKPGDPLNAARMEAFRKMNEPCARFHQDRQTGMRLSNRSQLVAQAAQQGYLPAIVEMRMMNDAINRRQAGGDTGRGYGWVTEVLESGDAAAMNLATGYIAGRSGGYMVAGQAVPQKDQEVAYAAWHMIVCDAGLPCDAPALLSYCAYSSVCNAKSYEEVVKRSLGEVRSSLAMTYKRQLLDALARKDFASMGLI